jgi:hypothetical protein
MVAGLGSGGLDVVAKIADRLGELLPENLEAGIERTHGLILSSAHETKSIVSIP